MTNQTKYDDDITVIDFPAPVDLAFGTSRVSWFITPRVVLNAMPDEWQQRFVDVIDELVETIDWQWDCPDLAIFQVDDQGENQVVPPDRFNNYRRPDKAWLQSITNRPKDPE